MKHTDITAEQFTEELKLPCVWPGMYPKHFVCEDGGSLCWECANKEKEHILIELADNCEPDWHVVAVDVNWEDPSLLCDHCGERIESAYAEDEAKAMGETV